MQPRMVCSFRVVEALLGGTPGQIEVEGKGFSWQWPLISLLGPLCFMSSFCSSVRLSLRALVISSLISDWLGLAPAQLNRLEFNSPCPAWPAHSPSCEHWLNPFILTEWCLCEDGTFSLYILNIWKQVEENTTPWRGLPVMTHLSRISAAHSHLEGKLLTTTPKNHIMDGVMEGWKDLIKLWV